MGINNIISLLGGVALFLFGMILMGDGLKKVAGSKLEMVLYKLSGTPFRGVLLGTGVTSIIQSSSATSVMVVGFVNSKMMTLKQAIGVVMGALIGTSITGWILCLSSIEGSGWVSLLSTSTITATVAVIGIVLRMFSHKQQHHHIGDILLGFAVLMFGMQTMSSAVSPLRSSEVFINLLTTFSNPFIGILVGAVFTSVIQSSSAAVGIVQALSMTGAITFDVAYPIILGIAIGAAVPVLLSALGASVDGRRTAFIYLIVETLGAVICGCVYYAVNAFVDLGLSHMIMSPVSIAIVNSLFRIATTIVLFPFISLLEKLVVSLIKDNVSAEDKKEELVQLDELFIKHPTLAIEQSRISVNAMAKAAGDNLLAALNLMQDYSEEGYAKVEAGEDIVDQYEDRIGTYLVRLNQEELTPEQNSMSSKYLHSLSDFERIGDHSMNLAELAKEIHEKQLVFSAPAQQEIRVLVGAVKEILELSVAAFMENDVDLAYRVEPLEEHIDRLCDEMKLRHIDRVQAGYCSLLHGFVFNDMLTNLERVADHCSNLAVVMIELAANSFDTHRYILDLKELRSNSFDEYYNEYSRKYSI